jgi:hypothetical protein
MKQLLLFLFALLFTAAVFSQNVDTSTTYQPINGIWQPVFRYVTTYNASCKAFTTLYQVWVASSSTWADDQLTTYTYNPGNQVIQQTIRVWDTSTKSWDNSEQYINTYNSNNLPDSVQWQVWLTGAWQNYTLTTYSYNVDNLEDTSTIQTWPGTNWTNSMQSVFSHNADSTTHEIFYYIWEFGQGWYVHARASYDYGTSSTRVTLIDSAIWNGNFHQPCSTWDHWEEAGYETFTYDSDGALKTVAEISLSNPYLCPPTHCSLCYQKSLIGQTKYTYNSDGTLAESFSTQGSDSAETTFHYAAPCLLPLTLLSFTATLDDKAAQLQWTTATEINTKNFIIQRGIDAMHFQNIGSVNAVGNSTQITSYSFADADAFNAGANKLYYRLQMVDKDGKFTYSNIATVQIVSGKLFVIYPNPVKDELSLTSNVSLNNVQIRISDPGGRVVYQQQILNTQPGTTPINVSGFAKGVYYLQLITGGNTQTTKFVKF